MRWNLPVRCLVLEGGFNERNKFVHIPLGTYKKGKISIEKLQTLMASGKELEELSAELGNAI